MSRIQQALERIVNMQTEAVATHLPDVTGKPYGLWVQEDTPYWTNQVVNYTVDRETLSFESIEIREYTVNMRLIMGSYDESQNYEGFMQDTAHDAIEAVLNFFALNPHLTNSTDSGEYPYIASEMGGAYISAGTGMRILNSGDGQKIAADFTLILPIFYNIFE